ncbi:MAG: hypothetical protein DMF81_23365 [Acidobacteria bacterium]|nr:MAG: hypothetical protein DMF81_23365 [Acidobacteriota bacterium]
MSSFTPRARPGSGPSGRDMASLVNRWLWFIRNRRKTRSAAEKMWSTRKPPSWPSIRWFWRTK